ncbi:10785_t:CDS:10, partial [Entrophospora sp. SA101]
SRKIALTPVTNDFQLEGAIFLFKGAGHSDDENWLRRTAEFEAELKRSGYNLDNNDDTNFTSAPIHIEPLANDSADFLSVPVPIESSTSLNDHGWAPKQTIIIIAVKMIKWKNNSNRRNYNNNYSRDNNNIRDSAISFFIYKTLIEPFYLSPLRKIPGPPSESILLGNFPTVAADIGKAHFEWKKKYGGILIYRGLLNEPIVLLTDPKYYPPILTNNAYGFFKTMEFTTDLRIVLGDGILFAEGDQHKRQRKMMNPAFSFTNLKEMVPTIINVTNKLNDMLNDVIGNQDEKLIVNINSYISKATLDIIGLVGFQYEFNSLSSENELAAAYDEIFNPKITFMNFLLMVISDKFKWIRYLPFEANIKLINSVKVIERISLHIIRERQKQAQLKKLEGKDLLSLLININQDLPPEEKITALSWSLYLLAKHPEVQDCLRQELLEALPDPNLEASFDKINSLEYLNCVFKETMRVIPTVPAVARNSETDTTIDGYFIPKKTPIAVSIYSAHHDSKIWGEDHDKFEPSRWLDPNLTSEINNYTYLPFLTGPRSCIGFKLATTEFKIILSSLIRKFKFREVEGFQIKKKFGVITRPDPGIDLYVSK